MNNDIERKDWWTDIMDLAEEIKTETIARVVEIKNDIEEDYLKLLDDVE